MHDHSHDHASEEITHVFSEATPYEQSLISRQQLLHIATELLKSGIDESGKFTVSPVEAAQRAHELLQEADKIVVSCRTDIYPPEE